MSGALREMAGRLGSAGTVDWSPSCGLYSVSVLGQLDMQHGGGSGLPERMFPEA